MEVIRPWLMTSYWNNHGDDPLGHNHGLETSISFSAQRSWDSPKHLNLLLHHLHFWVNLITTSLFSRTLESWSIRGMIPTYMVQHFRLVKHHFFFTQINIDSNHSIITINNNHWFFFTQPFLLFFNFFMLTMVNPHLPRVVKPSHHGGLRETGALGDAGVSVPGGALIAGWFTIGKIYKASTMEDLGGPMGTNGYHYFRKPPYIYIIIYIYINNIIYIYGYLQ